MDNKWELCVSDYRHDFKGRSEREIQIATEELRQRNRQHGRRFNITQKQLALFLRSPEAEEVLLMQRLRDAESKQVIDVINNPVDPEKAASSSSLLAEVMIENRPTSVLEENPETQKRTRKLKIYEDY